jgi:hypothetical protein
VRDLLPTPDIVDPVDHDREYMDAFKPGIPGLGWTPVRRKEGLYATLRDRVT